MDCELPKVRVYVKKTNKEISVEILAPTAVSEDYLLKSVVWINNTALLIIWMDRYERTASWQICTYPELLCDEVRN